MKRCSRCGEVKPLAEFYRNRAQRDGWNNRCKPCQAKSQREIRHRHPDVPKAQSRAYYERHAATERERALAYKAANAEKARAHVEVRRAIDRGDLRRPAHCEQCGDGRFRIQAHHEDYAKPLEVEWLCQSCHWHRHHEGGRVTRRWHETYARLLMDALARENGNGNGVHPA